MKRVLATLFMLRLFRGLWPQPPCQEPFDGSFCSIACPALKLFLSLLCLLPFCTICTERQAPCRAYCLAAMRPLHVPAPVGVAMRIASAVVMGLLPGPHSWVGILSSLQLLLQLRADETAQECDVCGRPRLYSHS